MSCDYDLLPDSTIDVDLDSLHAEKDAVTGVTANIGAASGGNTGKKGGVTSVTDFPPVDKRPCYGVYGNKCGPDRNRPPGVYWHTMTKPGKDDLPTTEDIWICAPLKVVAIARNKKTDREFGQVIEFVNKDGKAKRWNMPSRLLAGRGDEIQRELLDSGLAINYTMRGKIAEYINNQHPKEKVWTASTCGWFDDVFVLPNGVIGDGADSVMYQCETQRDIDVFAQSGSLKQWQNHVSRYCVGNPLLLLALSTAFSGPLLEKCMIDGIGIHIFGASSKGKTSGMRLAGSVWGEQKRFIRSWTTTANGLEAAATGVNDGLLCLDEMSRADAHEVAKSLYMLANGSGKQRADMTGSARPINRWRIAVLSTGEESIETHLAKGGINAKPGELIRFLQLPIFGETGVFDDLHSVGSGRQFSELLAVNAAKYYGTPGIEFLEKLTRDKCNFCDLLEQFFNIFEKQCGVLSPQEGRAARAFALIGMAGELATEYGVTGWPERCAIDAALLCFKKWREHRGHGELEPKQLVNALRQYTELYGDARFTCTTDDTRLHGERSGYWRDSNGMRQWLFSSAGFKKAIGNADTQQAAQLLIAQGVLIPGPKRNVTQVRHNSGEGTNWFYVICFGEIENAG